MNDTHPSSAKWRQPLRTLAALGSSGLILLAPLVGQADGPPASAVAQALPQDAQRYLRYSYPAAMKVPVPTPASGTTGLPAVLHASQTHRNASGQLGVYLGLGDVDTASHPFFQPLGSNGRSCFSCHQPADGMSISPKTLQQLFTATRGRDPVFAPVDGANCPSMVVPGAAVQGRGGVAAPVARDAYSLLLGKGLFRVFLPVPKEAEFSITVVSDPYGCNTDPAYATQVDPVSGETQQMVSVYRRPRMSANLKYATVPALTLGGGGLPNIDFVTGQPVVDPTTGLPIGGNLMWDGREPTLEAQAVAATLGHAQALSAPTAAQVAEIVAFENSVYAAQTSDSAAGNLSASSGTLVYGGPKFMAETPPSFGLFTLYDNWQVTAPATRDADRAAARAAIARGQALFNSRLFAVDNVAGLNNAALLGVTNPFVTACSSCHGNLQAGFDPFPAGQRDIGIGGHAARFGGPSPSADLPIFKLVCKPGASASFYDGEILTNDPGMALISGRCADIGRRSVPQLRALASRAPFFSDGSAATIKDIVKFYDTRFGIGLTAGDIEDLTAFLRAL